MIGVLIVLAAVVAGIFYFIGKAEPRRELRDAAVYLILLALVLIGLVVSNYISGGRP